MLASLVQMRNRGNGKGGGVAAVGMDASFFGVDASLLENSILLAIAYLDLSCRHEVEKAFIHPIFEIHHIKEMVPSSDFKPEIAPPHPIVYFVTLKPGLAHTLAEEEELIYQNSFRLNHAFYASGGEKRAFVLSHGRNLLVLKMVGYGDDVIRYYQLENLHAHVWIGHHRYPTKGKVWHPGGAHPFIGLNEALVHNGDFANYYSMSEYLKQRDITPLFFTDTEVAALLFDLYHRRYCYSLEHVIEAFAPTTERDFTLLPPDKQKKYKTLQQVHIHGSPDGPWFFLIAQSLKGEYSLIGITDTSMLRPQVFALEQSPSHAIGLAASEKQAIDACLESLAEENPNYASVADHYWNARGGSYNNGGAFIFSVNDQGAFRCTDKFGRAPFPTSAENTKRSAAPLSFPSLSQENLEEWVKERHEGWDELAWNSLLSHCLEQAKEKTSRKKALSFFTYLLHPPFSPSLRKGRFLSLVQTHLNALFELFETDPVPHYPTWQGDQPCSIPASTLDTLLINAKLFTPEGPNSLARGIVEAHRLGYKQVIVFNCRGHRFIGSGLGPATEGFRLEVYGSSGDYLGSGLAGAEVIVHGSGQDQLGQIMLEGSLVVHGDIGQTFMYGAKGGKAFIKGNAGGRALINAVGKPRIVINGTCLDYLAESFMAGNPLKEGGFVVVNAITLNASGHIQSLENPYPGGNLFSLASGGALYFRDPKGLLSEEQLNGGEFAEVTEEDFNLLLPYLKENESHFSIPCDELLMHEGVSHPFHQVYRKIRPAKTHILQEEEAWVRGKD